MLYMNDEQPQSCRLIAQAHAPIADDAIVTLTAVHRDHVEFHMQSADGAGTVSVSWLRPISTRGDVRVGLMDLLEDAINRLSQ